MGWLLDFWRLGKTKNEVLQRELVEDEICEILKENTKGLIPTHPSSSSTFIIWFQMRVLCVFLFLNCNSNK
jgi:hypothetical protein